VLSLVVIAHHRYALLRYGLGMSQFQSEPDRADRLGAFGMTTKAKNAAFKSWSVPLWLTVARFDSECGKDIPLSSGLSGHAAAQV
jgi:hypothetical protein